MKQHMKRHIRTLISIALILIVVPVVFADLVQLSEGTATTIDSSNIRVKKVEYLKQEYCRVKVDDLEDQDIEVGTAKQVGRFYIQATDAEEGKCSLIITPKEKVQIEEYDLIDVLSNKKTYKTGERAFTLEAQEQDDNKIVFVMTSEESQTTTSPLGKDSLYTFPDGSTITILSMEQGSNVKFAMKIGEQAPSLPVSPQEETATQQEQQPSPEAQRAEEAGGSEQDTKEAARKIRKKEIAARKELIKDKQNPQHHACGPGYCYANSEFNNCLRARMRVYINDIPSYCDSDGQIKPQKEAGEPAEYSYECKSNVLAENTCLAMKQDNSLFTKVWGRLFRLFG